MRLGSVLFLCLVSCTARPAPDIVLHTRLLPVSFVDTGLPQGQAIERWLESRSSNGIVSWEANDCGEQTGSPETTPGDFPICAAATFFNCKGEKSIIWFAVGTANGGITGKPLVFFAQTGTRDAATLEAFAALNPQCARE